MPSGEPWRQRLTEPVTRYQLPLIPVVLGVGVVLWLVIAALVDGRWLLGLAALVVAALWMFGWISVRRRRLRRALVLPPSARAERRAERRAAKPGTDRSAEDPDRE